MIPMIDWEDRAKTAEAELERVKAERDEWKRTAELLQRDLAEIEGEASDVRE